MIQPVLQIRDLNVELWRGHLRMRIVRDASLDLAPGEILGLVGESGAGKSMLGSAITGLIEMPLMRTSGQITLDGQRIDTLSQRRMADIRGAGIGMIFQDPLTSLNPVFTIGRQLVETIERHTDRHGSNARAEAVSLLQQVGIPAAEARLGSFPHEFSGGMRQRVVIALALAGRPKVIIADEPTTALDVSIQAQIINLLKRICRERGTAVILVTHDMGVIANAASRVAVMYAGRIVEIGPVAQVISGARHPYTRSLMRSIPEVGRRHHRLPQLKGAMPRPDALPQGCAFNPRCERASDRCRAERPDLRDQAACFHPLSSEDAA
ncbi:ABC transporter ATP-binding protein [Falsirhodobacter sp. 1013]|uniref:ABC transporter ATP-binding protein n=1 Tax=Falsirhodobacter sp. 1013 TaxID=3417566 RepID=UPI003EB7EC54